MTQIRSLTQPLSRRPGELGVHSLDHFNFSVPNAEDARRFYSSFGLDLREESGRLNLHTHGHPHRWGSIIEGPRKKLQFIPSVRSRRPAALPRAAWRATDRAHRSAARAHERALVPRSRRHADRNPRG
jgi:catechol 2,3-dioxygenase-like lactoylglutathione lyase family enzyme